MRCQLCTEQYFGYITAGRITINLLVYVIFLFAVGAGMKKSLISVFTLLGVMVVSVLLAELFSLSVTAMVLIATIGSLICLLILFVVPRVRRQVAEREYRQLLREGMHLIVGRARYRGRRVLHYADGSVAVQTASGMLAFDSFDACRRFVDRR
jgi:hypothetical protein